MLARPQFTAQHKAIIAGHHDVKHYEIDAIGFEKRAHLPSVGGDRYAKAVLLEVSGNEVPYLSVVIDDQNMVNVIHLHDFQTVILPPVSFYGGSRIGDCKKFVSACISSPRRYTA